MSEAGHRDGEEGPGPTEVRLARAALSRVGEPGDPRLTMLCSRLGPVELLAQLADDRDVTGHRSDVAARVARLDPEGELARAAEQGIRFVVPGDAEWPDGLDDLTHAATVQQRGGCPVGLWVQGPLRLDEAVAGSVAVVGARSATSYGAAVADQLGAGLARAGRPVVSGAAFGIDQAGHRGALAGGGVTVAVLACGADRDYPQGHQLLLGHIREHGLVVSEAPPGCAPTRYRFLARNRLIAAMTVGTVVVEAALRSGALNTANWAERLHRVLMGVPGPVTSATSAGVHELIRTRGANLVTRAPDVLDLVGSPGQDTAEERHGAARPRDALDDLARQVLDAVPVVRPAELASIARTAGVGQARAAGALEELERERFVLREREGWRLGPLAVSGVATLL